MLVFISGAVNKIIYFDTKLLEFLWILEKKTYYNDRYCFVCNILENLDQLLLSTDCLLSKTPSSFNDFPAETILPAFGI